MLVSVAKGTVRLKGRELLRRHGVNMHEVSLGGGLTYATVHKYVKKPEDVKRWDGEVLYSFLLNLGLTAEEIEDLRFGDVFELVPATEQDD